MNILEAMKVRHSVRQYTDKPIEREILEGRAGRIPEAPVPVRENEHPGTARKPDRRRARRKQQDFG